MIANSLPKRYHSASEILTVLYQKHISKNTYYALNNVYTSSSNINSITPTHQSVLSQLIRQKFTFETAKIEIFKTGVIRFGREETETKIIKISGEAESIIQDLGSGVTLEMVYIPAGSCMIGSNGHSGDGLPIDNEQPIHRVNFLPFYMGKYSVTQRQYKAIMGGNPSHFKIYSNDDFPVETVGWNDAVKFCEKLSQLAGHQYSLPSESQWEYACRAGTNTRFCFGEEITDDLANCGKVNCGNGGTTPVGSFPPNAFGLYDMHGNVWEWCLDV